MKKIIILLIVFLGLGAVVLVGVSYWRSGNWRQTVFDQVGGRLVKDEKQLNLFQELLGFKEPKTFLVLFLNNTEIRPGGGFIGTYSVVRVDRGDPEMLKTEGTEILDYSTAGENLPAPPKPLKDFILVDKWYFRDSNWSPDFKIAAEKSLEMYKLEQGIEADNIDVVVAFTPTLIEELLKITGPINVRGEEFNYQNFLEKVQYEVEYGFAPKGVPRSDRKGILGDMTKELIKKLPMQVFSNWQIYFDLWKEMVAEKQIMFYAVDPELQSIFKIQNWSGEMTQVEHDYMLWVDANLGAMKTDFSIVRTLNYEIVPTSSGKFLATVTMEYQHKGVFDWRTTRYRSYTRVYVPSGSKFISALGTMEKDKSSVPGKVDVGSENGKEWFGGFISIEPGRTGRLSFTYLLPDRINKQIELGQYSLLLQKQLGLVDMGLKVKLNFDRPILSAFPGEEKEKHGDNLYEFSGLIKTDREFIVKF